jgi:hypothetical protein
MPLPNPGTADRGEFRMSVPAGEYHLLGSARLSEREPAARTSQPRLSLGPVYGPSEWLLSGVKEPAQRGGGNRRRETGGFRASVWRRRRVTVNKDLKRRQVK